MKHLGYVDRVSGYIPCRAGDDMAIMSHRNRELVVPDSVYASVEILFIYFTSLCLSISIISLQERTNKFTVYHAVDIFAYTTLLNIYT